MLDQKTKVMSVNDLTPADYNPRLDLQPGEEEYEKLKKSIEEFGYVEKIIWNERTGRIVGGHQRWKVLKDLGYTEIRVTVIDEPEEREKMLNIALNKIGGDWDPAKLKDLLEELDNGLNEIELTGFNLEELENLMTQYHVDPEAEEFFPEDEGPILGNTEESNFTEQYAVIVTCEGEEDQEKTYNKLTEMGLNCKVVNV